EDASLGQAKQLLGMDWRRRRAERRYRIADTMLRERDDVHVALDDHHLAGVANRAAGQVQAVKLAAFGEDRRFLRVEVLGLAAPQHPAAEADDAPAAVMD